MFPSLPPRHSLEDWYKQHEKRYQINHDQQIAADRILAESDVARDKAADIVIKNKKQTEHYTEARKTDIEHQKYEIEQQRTALCKQLEALDAYLIRLKDMKAFLVNNAVPNCKQCQNLRENRIGIDLCNDNVDKQLMREIDLYEGASKLLTKTIERTEQQIRRCQNVVHFLDKDLTDKDVALKIEGDNINLNETDMDLQMVNKFNKLIPPKVKYEEWETLTYNVILRGKKEVTLTRELLSYIDTIIMQIRKDLQNQFELTNTAFKSRIEEMKESKFKFERQHNEVTKRVTDMKENIARLQIAIADKEGFVALAHVRLCNRAQRPRLELCNDMVDASLVNEVRELRENVAMLRNQVLEAECALRYLAKTQLELEEDINIKSNSIDIDFVQCMTLRQNIDFYKY